MMYARGGRRQEITGPLGALARPGHFGADLDSRVLLVGSNDGALRPHLAITSAGGERADGFRG
jgi:hypothetical protein